MIRRFQQVITLKRQEYTITDRPRPRWLELAAVGLVIVGVILPVLASDISLATWAWLLPTIAAV